MVSFSVNDEVSAVMNSLLHPLQLQRVRLANIRTFPKVDFHLQKKTARSMNILLGANGSGKSTFLRAVAIGLCQQKEASALAGDLSGELIRRNKRNRKMQTAEIVLDLMDHHNPETIYQIKTVLKTDESGQEILEKETIPANFPWHRIFVCGYGVNRGSHRTFTVRKYKVRDAVQTLFSDDAGLAEPEAVLRNFKLAEYDNTGNKSDFKGVESLLKKVLHLNSNHRLEVTSEHVKIHGPWGGMPFHALGDGYRGTSGWILDFLSRAQSAGFPLTNKGPGGILLIDEIDEHLHPSWQRNILNNLKQLFSNVQIIGTTHSPLTIVNSKPGETAVCRLSNAVGSIEQQLPDSQGKTADQLLRGEWFGLSATMDDTSNKLLNQ